MFQRRKAAAWLSATVLAVTGIGAFTATTAQAAVGCSVEYKVTNQWGGGFGADVKVTNLGDPVSSWDVQWTFGGGQQVTQLWNGVASQSGAVVTVRNHTWNGSLAKGASAGFGFNGSWSGSNPVPTTFRLNGTTCTGGTTTTPTPTPTATSTPRPTATPTATATPRPTSTPTPTATTTPPPTGGGKGPVGSPAQVNGQLHVCGVNLCNRFNQPIQLRGVSTHGIQWFASCYTDATWDALATDWRADVARVAMYVQEQGYETNPSLFTDRVNTYVDEISERGMYAIIDFHLLNPGDPNYNLDRAKTFFASVAKRNAANPNVIYEIANEPNGVSWAGIKSYAEQVIPVIRAADPDAVILVGTRAWSSLGVSEGSNEAEVVNNPVNATNIMYTFHFYAGSHQQSYRDVLSRAAGRIPMFVTEFGTPSASGDGPNDLASTAAWLDLLESKKISWVAWNWSDKGESSGLLKQGACSGGSQSGTGVLKEGGVFLRERTRTADVFPTA
ncbi:cellulase family glycosylhydrolase [Cellulomonas cellasea]|uniref:Endoglucanase n=1 Tax=Cellulomonas cellasea TaxID=43670 RepID=A0A7W4UJQ8_9CELL|nr:cellulase family glycosylhydrolase [Cellulomonas cellasea]MBB2925427.1 endoglucanase [Cellulomonas cellasea]